MENLSNNQELLKLVIRSFILLTLMFDSGVIWLGEIRYQSPLGVKGFIKIMRRKEMIASLGSFDHYTNSPC